MEHDTTELLRMASEAELTIHERAARRECDWHLLGLIVTERRRRHGKAA